MKETEHIHILRWIFPRKFHPLFPNWFSSDVDGQSSASPHSMSDFDDRFDVYFGDFGLKISFLKGT